MEILLLFAFLIVCLMVYFIPAEIAHMRKHRNFAAILILNIFLGWTFIGWVVALIWAAYREAPKQINKSC